MKYCIKFCGCGRIHAVSSVDVSDAISNEMEVLLICGRCGVADRIGADTDADGYSLYDIPLIPNRNIFSDDLVYVNKTKFSKIIYSLGYPVPLKSGHIASGKVSGGFIDDSTGSLCCVDMETLIKTIPDDVLEDISGYVVQGFDWSGTKYENNI